MGQSRSHLTVTAELRSQRQGNCSKFINLLYKSTYKTFTIKMDRGIKKNRNKGHFRQSGARKRKGRHKNPGTMRFFVF